MIIDSPRKRTGQRLKEIMTQCLSAYQYQSASNFRRFRQSCNVPRSVSRSKCHKFSPFWAKEQVSHRANQDQSATNFRRFRQKSKCPTERIKIKVPLTFAVFGKGASVPHDAATQLADNSGHSETPRQSCADRPRPLGGHRVHVHDV